MSGIPGADRGHQFPVTLAGGRPKGAALREILERLITALGPGSLLPSERMLAERYGLARTTVRQVIDELVLEGRAYRLQGSGTFVGGDHAHPPASLLSFADDMYSRDMQPGERTLSRGVITAGELIGLHLEVVVGAEILHLESLLIADGEPMAIRRRYLPVRPAFAYARGESQLEVPEHPSPHVYADQWAAAVRLPDQERETLHANAGEPGLLVQHVLRDARRVVVEYTRVLYRGDRYELHGSLRGD